MKIGVVGRGFVGGSIEKFISNNTVHAVISYDIKDDSNIQKSYQKIVDECSIIYLCSAGNHS